MSSIILAYAAGILATLSPCVLPLLPIVLGSALDRHRLAPLALAVGMAGAFGAIGVTLALVGFSVGLDPHLVRSVGAVLMVVFGAILMSSALQMRFATAGGVLTQPLSGLTARFAPEGVAGHAGLGALLGIIWAPCTGPLLGSALSAAGQADTAGYAAAIMVVFALGAATPVVALAYGSRSLLASRKQTLARLASRAKPIMGGALMLVGMLVLTGLDRAIETEFLKIAPSWWTGLTVAI